MVINSLCNTECNKSIARHHGTDASASIEQHTMAEACWVAVVCVHASTSRWGVGMSKHAVL